MRPTTSTRRAVPGLLVAVVVSIVLGILGMHALSTHGVMGEADHGGHATMDGGATSADMPGAATIIDPGADPVLEPAAGVSDGSGEGGGHDMGGMVMLCAAMLAATAAALLLLAALGTRRTPRFWALLPTAATSTTRWVTSRLGTGPPPVWEFSVVRC
ncbi:DUF6153 family protein [Nocardioides sp. AX2bis]|uniref:DUF6153 family protein n=1 Tax=Nocardioides sp. AX2bis TaxID=2653157 RepID=UPI0012F0A6D3|nr:DUF6153 family protein [Nocardioides sp. AX2bis]VXB27338.1 conserved hypothetical protein [Nocardioides sp. AX2bis]